MEIAVLSTQHVLTCLIPTYEVSMTSIFIWRMKKLESGVITSRAAVLLQAIHGFYSFTLIP